MLKSVVVHDIPMNAIAAMERWYWRDHAPEINRRFGPWLLRHDSYLPVDAPADARGHGHYNWRVTEGYWREMPLPGAHGALAFTVPPVWPRVATGFFEAQATEDFLGAGRQPGAPAALRWYCLTHYPEGVGVRDGERWFIDVHAPQLARFGGPVRAFSTLASRDSPALPGEWPPQAAPPRDSVLSHWHRLTELWFETFDQWRVFVDSVAPRFTPPPWAKRARYPFLECGRDFVSSFLLERPADEFARDARGYL